LNNLKKPAVLDEPMARTLVRTRKVGGSLMVTIPKEVVDQEDIREGEIVEVEVRKAQRSFFGITPGIGPFTRDDKMKDHD
jgi:antitoxin component of MazEF toxin-antitoxin module